MPRRAPSSTWASSAGTPHAATSRWTPSSSARAPTRASKTSRRRRRRSKDAHVATGVRALVVPGSRRGEGTGRNGRARPVFVQAGFEWREAGVFDVPGNEPGRVSPGERCASTSNRNFEGRQGRDGRTHLVSPAVAAATAVAGHLGLASPTRSSTEGSTRCYGSRRTARSLRRRYRPDHPGVWLKRVERTGFGAGPVLGVAATIRISSSTGPNTRGATDPSRRPEFRHRFVQGARRLGADRLRLQSGDLARFGDIFRNNSTKRAWYRYRSSPGCPGPPRCRGQGPFSRDHRRPRAAAGGGPRRRDRGDLPARPVHRERLLNGWDDIGLTLRHQDAISRYERGRSQ